MLLREDAYSCACVWYASYLFISTTIGAWPTVLGCRESSNVAVVFCVLHVNSAKTSAPFLHRFCVPSYLLPIGFFKIAETPAWPLAKKYDDKKLHFLKDLIPLSKYYSCIYIAIVVFSAFFCSVFNNPYRMHFTSY